jgi:hypothetical protein
MYFNGSKTAATKMSGDLSSVGSLNSGNPVRIGYGLSGLSYFDGRIDEVLIFNRTISAEQINAIYSDLLFDNSVLISDAMNPLQRLFHKRAWPEGSPQPIDVSMPPETVDAYPDEIYKISPEPFNDMAPEAPRYYPEGSSPDPYDYVEGSSPQPF